MGQDTGLLCVNKVRMMCSVLYLQNSLPRGYNLTVKIYGQTAGVPNLSDLRAVSNFTLDPSYLHDGNNWIPFTFDNDLIASGAMVVGQQYAIVVALNT